jgi:LysR family transcriptional regulator, transcriptional activator of the cysJI operon
MFDFRLKVFYAVATRLNFTKAAEELFITQPAVTKHIHELEEHFNVRLFERRGNKTFLTEEGKTLLVHVNKLQQAYTEMELDMNSFTNKQSGQLRLGASTTIAQYVISPLLAAFHQKYKDIHIHLIHGNTEQIELALQQKEIDLGMIEGHSKNRDIKYIPFLKDELVLVTNYNSALAKKASISLDELKKIPLLLRENGSGSLEVIVHALKEKGIKLSQLNIEMQLGTTEGIISYLKHSNCVAFLSIHSILMELYQKTLRIIDVKGLSVERPFYFIHLHGDTFAPSALFMKFANQYNFR